MLRKLFNPLIVFFGLSFILPSCTRSSGSAWEDTKTLGRYIQRGSKLLFKQNPDSRQIQDKNDFFGPAEDDFIPLNQQDLLAVAASEEPNQVKEVQITPAAEIITPSAKEVSIPNIESFKKPSHDLASIFKTVHFNTDDHVLRDNQALSTIDQISNYMKKHKDLYVFVLGHCDERGSEAYNLSLGTKRASYVRNLLVKKGIDPAHIFTISFGKELPIDQRHHQDAWSKNRRAEFKIYEKTSANIK